MPKISKANHNKLAEHLINGAEKSLVLGLLAAICPPLAGTVALIETVEKIYEVANVMKNLPKAEANGKLAAVLLDQGIEVVCE